MSLLLVQAAKKLGSDIEIMDSYWAYHEREQNWFFSPNPNLDQACRKPTSFDNWNSWNRLSTKQKMTLSTLAGFKNDATDIKKNKNHFSKLREAYMSKWRADLYSIFWANEGNGKLWLCNVFVGDAIYLCNRKNFTSGNNHYYDPKQIYGGQSPLRKRSDYKDIQAGDICVFGSHHVEIITRIQKNTFADDGFCSIGAGRGVNREQVGNVKCDSDWGWGLPYVGGSRELKDKNNSYYYI